MVLTGRERVFVTGVSPTGGLASSQESVTTQDIANLGINGGGFPSIVATGFTANATLGLLPSGAFLGPLLLLKETAGFACSISLGTTLGASDVLSAQSLSAAGVGTGTLTVAIDAFTKGSFPGGAQALFLTTSGGGSSVNVQLFYVVGLI